MTFVCCNLEKHRLMNNNWLTSIINDIWHILFILVWLGLCRDWQLYWLFWLCSVDSTHELRLYDFHIIHMSINFIINIIMIIIIVIIVTNLYMFHFVILLHIYNSTWLSLLFNLYFLWLFSTTRLYITYKLYTLYFININIMINIMIVIPWSHICSFSCIKLITIMLLVLLCYVYFDLSQWIILVYIYFIIINII